MMSQYKLMIATQDVSELVESVTWTGDTKQVSRKLAFTILQSATDTYIPHIALDLGAAVAFDVNGTEVFFGTLTTVSKTASGNTVSCNATDYMWYLMESEISKVFDTTPEQATAQICADLGIPFGGAAQTGITVYAPVLQKKAYEGIMMLYTAASKKTGKQYIPLIKNRDKVAVIEKGLHCGILLEAGNNLIDATYSNTLDKLVNKVVITNKDGSPIKVVQDQQSQVKYGTIQKILKQDNEDVTAEAKTMLKDFEQTASASGIGDIRAVSGYSLAIREPYTGLIGRFYIESDSHTFSNGKHGMQLTLAYDNLMDAKDIPKDNKS